MIPQHSSDGKRRDSPVGSSNSSVGSANAFPSCPIDQHLPKELGDLAHKLKWNSKKIWPAVSGWWYTYPSETYESQLGWWNSQLNGQIKNVPNHQPGFDSEVGLFTSSINGSTWEFHAINGNNVLLISDWITILNSMNNHIMFHW